MLAAFSINDFIIVCATSKSAITPSLSGLIATMFPGVLPIIIFASVPTASGFLVVLFIATTDGSLRTTPLPLTKTSVLAVPKSIPMSLLVPKNPIFHSPFEL